MTDPNFHQRMMGIPVDETSPAFPEPPHLQLVYRYGHRDAQHAAAEIANEADETIRELRRHIDDLMSGEALKAAKDLDNAHRALIARLRSDLRRQELCAEEVIRRLQSERRAALEEVDALTKALDMERTIAKNFRERQEEALEEVDRLTKARDYVTSELLSAVDRLGLRTALVDALKGADPDKATAEQLARFFWIWSHGERSRDRLEGAPEEAAALREEIAVLKRDRRDVRRDLIKIFETLRIEPSVAPAECLSTGALLTCLLGWAQHRAGERHTSNGRERFAAAANEARAWMQAHRGGEWVGWSCAVLTGTQEVTSPGWYALPPGQWCSEPAILIEHATRDGMELPTVAQAVETLGVPVKAEE